MLSRDISSTGRHSHVTTAALGGTCNGMSDGSRLMHVTIRGPAAVIASRDFAVRAVTMLQETLGV